jgi:hypothetical protein
MHGNNSRMALALSRWILTLLELGSVCFLVSAPTAAGKAALRLVADVRESRQIKGMRGIAVLRQEDLVSGTTQSRRVSVTSAAREGSLTVLFVARATASAPAAAVIITDSSGRRVSGFVFHGPDTVLPLTPALFERPFLGTDLTIGDLADDFLSWPAHEEIGREKVSGRDCVIIESRPSPTAGGSAVALVRSWIAPALALPLKIEKYNGAGDLLRRIDVRRMARIDDRHWGAVVLAVQGADARTRTELKMVKADRRADVLPHEFAVETILKSLSPPPAQNRRGSR